MADIQSTFGVGEDTWLQIGQLVAKLSRVDAAISFEAQAVVAELAAALAVNLRDRFQPHNRTGKTLSTLRIQIGTFWARVSMGAGAPYVQFGSLPHVITGSPLHWSGGKYGPGDHFARSVEHPGYHGDPFAAQAIADTMTETRLTHLFSTPTAAAELQRAILMHLA